MADECLKVENSEQNDDDNVQFNNIYTQRIKESEYEAAERVCVISDDARSPVWEDALKSDFNVDGKHGVAILIRI